MSDVDLLRRAAALMRERAEAARPGPYAVHVEPGDEYNQFWVTDPAGRPIAECAHPGLNPWPEANSAYLASWHPAMALAVAEMLETIDHLSAIETGVSPAIYVPVRAIARAYLGEDG